ncbi:MAG: GDSL-type esterase/lipase family protein [Caldicoprobacterales bacterium]
MISGNKAIICIFVCLLFIPFLIGCAEQSPASIAQQNREGEIDNPQEQTGAERITPAPAPTVRPREEAATNQKEYISEQPPESAEPLNETEELRDDEVNKTETEEPAAYGLLPRGEMQPMSYFDDAVFVGDSNTFTLKKYVDKKRQEDSNYLGKAKILTAVGYSLQFSLAPLDQEDAVHPEYGGRKWHVENFVACYGFKKVFICLGTNDIAKGVDKAVENYAELISRIREKSPDAEIYIQSIPPMSRRGQKKKLNNANIDKFNKKMLEWSAENQCYFLDVASIFKNNSGHLASRYSMDNYVHLSKRAVEPWIDYLRSHTKQQISGAGNH